MHPSFRLPQVPLNLHVINMGCFYAVARISRQFVVYTCSVSQKNVLLLWNNFLLYFDGFRHLSCRLKLCTESLLRCMLLPHLVFNDRQHSGHGFNEIASTGSRPLWILCLVVFRLTQVVIGFFFSKKDSWLNCLIITMLNSEGSTAQQHAKCSVGIHIKKFLLDFFFVILRISK